MARGPGGAGAPPEGARPEPERATERGRGRLYVVSTPIGNLEDVTLRSLRVLREADLIAAEDTRVTRVLLDRHGIDRPLTSLHEHNEDAKVPSILSALRDGKKIALVTDAGTPVMSDPGFRLVRAARDEGLAVEVIPGASAVTAAVAGAGVPVEAFAFVGFPPRRGGERDRWAKRVLALPTAVVFFESPHRLVATLEALAEVSPHREAAVCRELTKLHEEFVRGEIGELAKTFDDRERILGEITVVISSPGSVKLGERRPAREDDETTPASLGEEDDEGSTERTALLDPTEERTVDLEAEIARLKGTGLKDKEIAKEISRLTGRPAREVYADLVARKR